MDGSILLILLPIYVVACNSQLFNGYGRPQYNGFPDFGDVFQDLFPPQHRYRPRPPPPQFQGNMREGDMRYLNNQLPTHMTPVLVPINNVNYPETRLPLHNMGGSRDPDINHILHENTNPLSGDSKPEESSPTVSVTTPVIRERATTATPRLSTSAPVAIPNIVTTTSESPVKTNMQPPKSEENNVKNDASDANGNRTETNPMHLRENITPDSKPKINNSQKLTKDSLNISDVPKQNQIVFPDQVNEIKQKIEDKQNIHNRLGDGTPSELYAVDIGPIVDAAFDPDAAKLASNKINQRQTPQVTQTVPYTNNPTSYQQTPQYNQPSYAYPNPNPVNTNNAETNPYQNTIALPDSNGGTTLYTVLNLPTLDNSYYPSQTYQTNNVGSANYQTLPSNTGYQSSSPAYYVLSPNQNTQSNVAYNNNYYPQTYKVGYVSSDGQTVLVPSDSQLIQVVPQTNYAPSSGQGVSLSPAPSNVITVPDNTGTVTLLSFKDKVNAKPKENASDESEETNKEPDVKKENKSEELRKD